MAELGDIKAGETKDFYVELPRGVSPDSILAFKLEYTCGNCKGKFEKEFRARIGDNMATVNFGCPNCPRPSRARRWIGRIFGSVAERFKAAVLKTVRSKGLAGSNPAASGLKCPYDPRKVPPEAPIGMFHCPVCGEMVLAGLEHP